MSAPLAALVRQAAERLRGQLSPEQNPALDAEVLARFVLGWDRATWVAESRSAPPEGFAAEFDRLIARRLKGEPVAYLTRVREFWGLEFEVSPDVLIPRPETELLVERALAAIDHLARDGRRVRVLDLGTGSGCIAIALAHERPRIELVATDISGPALHMAIRNALRHNVRDRIVFQHAIGMLPVGDVDLVVSNPPYIAERDAQSLMKDVVGFEPHTALFASGDGLDVIRATLAEVAAREPAPQYIFEFGGNEDAVRAVVAASGLRITQVINDLAGIPRIAVVER